MKTPARLLALAIAILFTLPALAQRYPVYVANPAELVTLNPNTLQSLAITKSGDGVFQYISAHAGSTNTTTIFKPTGFNGRWVAVSASQLATNLLAQSGTAASPGIAWLSSTNTGFYLINTNAMGFSVTGTNRYEFNNLQFMVQDGTADYPGFSFLSDTNTGIASLADNQVDIVTDGTQRWYVTATGHLKPNGTLDIGDNSGVGPNDLFLYRDLYLLGSAGSLIVTNNAEVEIQFNGTAQDTEIRSADDLRIRAATGKLLSLGSNGADGQLTLNTDGNALVLTNSLAITTEAVDAKSYTLSAYDTDGAAAVAMITITSATNPVMIVRFRAGNLQTLEAATAITANSSKVRVVGTGGATTITAAPTIADGAEGQILYLVGTHDTNTVVVQDEGTLANSNLQLGAATRTLGAGDILTLMFDSGLGAWYEVSFTNN